MITENFIHLLARIQSAVFTLMIAHCFYAIGRNSKIIPPFRFANLKGIGIGTRVTIHRNCWIQTLRGVEDDADAPKLILGNNVSIGMDATISAAKKIIIDDNCLLARNVYISDHGHQFEDVALPIRLQGIRKVAQVTIGANTWLGQNCVILPGVTIGKNCVVGANSVVNKSIPDYSVAAGVPARIVKRSIDGKFVRVTE